MSILFTISIIAHVPLSSLGIRALWKICQDGLVFTALETASAFRDGVEQRMAVSEDSPEAQECHQNRGKSTRQSQVSTKSMQDQRAVLSDPSSWADLSRRYSSLAYSGRVALNSTTINRWQHCILKAQRSHSSVLRLHKP